MACLVYLEIDLKMSSNPSGWSRPKALILGILRDRPVGPGWNSKACRILEMATRSSIVAKFLPMPSGIRAIDV